MIFKRNTTAVENKEAENVVVDGYTIIGSGFINSVVLKRLGSDYTNNAKSICGVVINPRGW